MPEKRYHRGCGGECLRCWRNRLKHGCPQAKKFLKKTESLQEANIWHVEGDRKFQQSKGERFNARLTREKEIEEAKTWEFQHKQDEVPQGETNPNPPKIRRTKRYQRNKSQKTSIKRGRRVESEKQLSLIMGGEPAKAPVDTSP